MRILILITSAVALLAAPPVFASPSTFKHVDVGYMFESVSNFRLNGFGISAAMPIASNVFITAGYATVSGSGFTTNAYSGGIGLHAPITNTTEWYVQGALTNGDSGGTSYTGNSFSGGIVLDVFPQVEGNISVVHSTANGSSSTGFSGGGVYHTSDKIGIGASFLLSNGDSVFQVGARISI